MTEKIINILKDVGIKDVGFCSFDAVKDRLLPCRAKQRLPEGAKSIIMCAFPYKVNDEPPKFLSRYASVPDYHNIVGNMLSKACKSLNQVYAENKFEFFCDNSPIPEVFAAATAGLGAVGDNGLLITKKYGSFVFLGEIITDLHIDTTDNYAECEHCGKCKFACPVALNKGVCLSNLSQKKKLEDNELNLLKQNSILWGCDICANACPHNKNAQITDIAEFINGYRETYTVGEDNANRPYTWRGTEPIKRNYENLRK